MPASLSGQYFDLNLRDRQPGTVSRALHLGYRHLAFAQVHTDLKSPPPAPPPPTEAFRTPCWSSESGWRLTRLTLAPGPEAQESDLRLYFRQFAKQLEAYDILALSPRSPAAAKLAADSLPIDLLAPDLTAKPDAFWSDRRDMRAIARRGIKIEVSLQPLLQSQAGRVYASTLVFELLTSARVPPSALLLSSGAACPWDIRDPLGASAVAASLGIPPDKSRACVSDNCLALMERAMSRRLTLHGAVAVAKLARLPGVKSVQIAAPGGSDADSRKRDGLETDEEREKLMALLLPAKRRKLKISGARVLPG